MTTTTETKTFVDFELDKFDIYGYITVAHCLCLKRGKKAIYMDIDMDGNRLLFVEYTNEYMMVENEKKWFRKSHEDFNFQLWIFKSIRWLLED